MISLLNVALKNLLNQKQIKRIDVTGKDFIAFQRNGKNTDHHLMYLYTKNVIEVYPNKRDSFDLLFDETTDVHSILNAHHFSDKLPAVSIFLPINYHGKNKAHLGALDVSFTALLEIKIDNKKLSLNIFSPDSYGADDEYIAVKKKLLDQLHFQHGDSGDNPHESVIVMPNYLSHHSNSSTKGVNSKLDVWMMVYAAKLMEGKDPLLNDGKGVASFKADPLFNFDINQQVLDLKDTSKSSIHRLAKTAGSNSQSNKEKSLLERVWESDWGVDVAALDENPNNGIKKAISVTSQVNNSMSKNDHSIPGGVHVAALRLNVVADFDPSQKGVATVMTNQNDNKKYSLEQFRLDIKNSLNSIDKHIAVLNNDLKMTTNISSAEKNIKKAKIAAMQTILSELSNKKNFMADDVKSVIVDAIKKYPGCKKGIWMGSIFKSRTEILLDSMLGCADRYIKCGEGSLKKTIRSIK